MQIRSEREMPWNNIKLRNGLNSKEVKAYERKQNFPRDHVEGSVMVKQLRSRVYGAHLMTTNRQLEAYLRRRPRITDGLAW